jgi:ATP adenylyltransferase
MCIVNGFLRETIEQRTREALASGAMQPIETEQIGIEDGGVRFVVRKVSSLARKELARRAAGSGPAPVNPFLPPEPELLVGEISDAHLAVLNKFNVIERHLLIVTRRFEHQECLLNRDDFAALAACMAQIGGLGFYNGGTDAGASQPHKHLQRVPLPLADDGPALPLEALMPVDPQGIAVLQGLTFDHAWAPLSAGLFDSADAAGAVIDDLYRRLLERVGLGAVRVGDEERQSAPYNLLLTRRWMLLVPRSREHYEGISVNALGFAGSLFVKDDGQLELVRRVGPMNVLRGVARP